MARAVAPALPAIPSTALVASAARYTGGRAPRIHAQRKDWQEECYRHFYICGEAQYAAMYFSHAIGRATLRTARMTPDGQEFTKEGEAHDILEDLYTGPHGQAEMLSSIGLHLTIAGECYLVGRSPTETEQDEGIVDEVVWEIVSVMEMKVNGKRWSIDYGEGYAPIPLTDEDVVVRIWTPAPDKRIEAHSPFRSLLPILTEIEWLTRHIFAQTSSRLAGAGLLLLPNNVTYPTPENAGGLDLSNMNEADQFLLVLAEAMMKPIKDPSAPEALVPITVLLPPESISDVRHLTFWSELDGESQNLRGEAIRRFAIGMNLPVEEVLGMSGSEGTGGGASNGVSHWGAWQIEESTVKMHVEPVLNVVCNALTVKYLRPAADTDEYITYDTSALRLRPDRSKEAMELYAMGALSLQRMLEENGFSISDLPSEEEFRRWLLVKVASGSATPEQVEAALEEFGVMLDSQRFGELPGEVRETRPDPSLEEHPTRPRTPGEDEPLLPSALLMASEGLVLRALERAGNRVINAGGKVRGKDKPTDVVPHEAHLSLHINGQGPSLLTNAFSTAPLVLSGIAEPGEIVPALESYCLYLFSHQKAHQREMLQEWLERAK